MKPLFERWSGFLPKVAVHLSSVDKCVVELKKWQAADFAAIR